MKKKEGKESEETKRSSKSWFGIDAELDTHQSEPATPSPASSTTRARPLRAPTANDSLSEWELPETPSSSKRRSFEFESPLRGDFTDLSAPVVMPGEDLLPITPAEPRRRNTRMTSSSRASSVSSPVEESYHLALHSKPAAKVDLGLDDASRRILARGVPEGVDITDEYMKERAMNDSQWTHAKHSMAPIPTLGSWEAEDTAARRVVDILTMPVHGPTPYYKGRDIRLFTHDEKEYFDKYPRNAKNYNRFIWSLCKNNDYPTARKAIEAMKEHGVPRDVGIYTSLIQGCSITKDPREAMRVFVEMRKDGIKPDLWAFDALMEVFVSSGELDGAFALYDELKPHGLKPSVIIFTTLVKGCLRDNDLERAWKVFDHMRVWHCEPDEILMNLMIHACAKNSEAERAMTLFNQLKGLGIRPTQVTFTSLMHAFSRRKDYYAQAWDMLRTMKVEGYAPDYRTFDMLLAVAGKGGDVATAELVFDEAVGVEGPKREQPYAFMIEAYAMAHRVHAEQPHLKKYIAKAEQLFDRMVSEGIKPTAMSCNLRLNVYTYNAMFTHAVEWKKTMKEVYGVQPDVYTYTSLIEMYGRTRQMDLALDQFNLMKAEGLTPSFTTYGVLIEGCTRSHLITTGMKLLREMKAKNIDIKPDHTFIVNFRRGLIKTPDIVREIDQLTGKAYRFVMPWRRKGSIKKTTYHRELTKEEAKRTSLYG